MTVIALVYKVHRMALSEYTSVRLPIIGTAKQAMQNQQRRAIARYPMKEIHAP
jgi:hypothetical protein